MNLNMRNVRATSLKKAMKLGYPINSDLPLLDVKAPRKQEEICNRMLCLTAVLAVAYGCPKQRALGWLKQENLTNQLTAAERTLLLNDADVEPFKDQVDGIYSLAWATSLVGNFEFDEVTPPNLISHFPDLRTMEPRAYFSKRLLLRPTVELLSKLDLAYCLHWAVRDALLNDMRPPGRLDPISVIERRRALEWLFSTDDWDQVELDT